MNKLIKKFGRIKDSIEIPLLSLQLDSSDKFLQNDVPPSMRTDVGLEGVFRSVFPIHTISTRPPLLSMSVMTSAAPSMMSMSALPRV